jgi:predicted nucleotidyltransferase component of viral defense system
MKNVGASVLANLKNLARETGQDMQSYIRLYAQQRLLYRVSVSSIAPLFVLKGGVMLSAYNKGALFRASDDIDFNGFLRDGGPEEVENAIRTVISTPVPDDGVVFDLTQMRTRKEHVGVIKGSKVSLVAHIHTAKVQLFVDIGIDNVITPDAQPVEIPTLLPNLVPCPVIAGYPLETIIAEKLHAVRQFGMDNTRLKDLYDLWKIQDEYTLDGVNVTRAVERTFAHQGSSIIPTLPGLSHDYAEQNKMSWPAFLRKNALTMDTPFTKIASDLRDFSDPILESAGGGDLTLIDWVPRSGWQKMRREITFGTRSSLS